MRSPTGPITLLGTLLCMSGCTAAADSSASVEPTDSAGIRIVESTAPRWEADEAWTIAPAPRLTIGVLDGAAAYQFVDVSSAARRSDGSVVVADRLMRTVRLYDGDGVLLETLGGPGSGPGEFQDPGPVRVFAGDSIVVWDHSALRVTRFDPEGGLVGIQTLDLATIAKAVEPPLYPGRVEPTADGGFLVRLVEKAAKGPPLGRSAGRFRPRSGALKVSADLQDVDTLMFFGDTEQTSVEAPFGTMALPPPLARTTVLTHRQGPPRVCFGEQERPEIHCFGAGEDSRMLLRWSSDPAPVTDEEVEAWREATIGVYSPKIGEGDMARILDLVPTPAVRPPYGRILLDPTGHLWVESGPLSGPGTPMVDFLVFDPEGALLGSVAVPRVRVLEVGEDYLLGVRRDEFDVEYVQEYRILKGPPGAGP